MITQASHTSLRPTPGSPALTGNKVPLPHRFHLTSGQVIAGKLHRSPSARLADHLSTLKGFISVTDAAIEATGETFSYLLLNQDHVLFIEELPSGPDRAPAAGGRGGADAQR